LGSFRSRLQQFKPAQLSAQDRLSVRILDWTLDDEIARIDALGEYDSVNHFFGGHLNIFSTLAIAPANTVKDYQDQIARLNAIPKWVDQAIAAAGYALAHKQVQPKLVAQLVSNNSKPRPLPNPSNPPY